jgi:hypothetical protein
MELTEGLEIAQRPQSEAAIHSASQLTSESVTQSLIQSFRQPFNYSPFAETRQLA